MFGDTLSIVNFDVGKTLFPYRLWCAAHTRGRVVIAVTTSRPVAAFSVCKSTGCDELTLRVPLLVGDAVLVFVCLFAIFQSAWFVEMFFILERSQQSLCADCFP